MSYNDLRHFADSYGLAAMLIVYLILVAWAFRPSMRRRNDEAAHMIFAEDEASQGGEGDRNHG